MGRKNKINDYHLKSQIDVDPMDRRDEKGALRMQLNSKERRELAVRNHIAKATALISTDRELPDIAQELGIDPDLLAHEMMYGGDEDAKRAVFKKLIDKLLDLDKGRKRNELAKEMGMRPGQLEHLLKQDAFREQWAEQFVSMRSDPNIQSVQKIVVEDLLPAALKSLRAELSVDAPWTVRQNARRDIFKLAGVESVHAEQSDRAAAVEFLERHDIRVQDGKLQLPIPQEYLDALANYIPSEVIDAEVTEAE